MFSPPLMIELTRYDNRTKDMFLVSNIHQVIDDIDHGVTIIRTLIGCMHGVACSDVAVKETKQQVMDKMGLVTRNFILNCKAVYQDEDDWRGDDDEPPSFKIWA